MKKTRDAIPESRLVSLGSAVTGVLCATVHRGCTAVRVLMGAGWLMGAGCCHASQESHICHSASLPSFLPLKLLGQNIQAAQGTSPVVTY